MTADLLLIVPARGGSKRLPGKHGRPLHGRTLLERTADAIAEAGTGGTVLLTTDDPAIADQGRALGWLVPFLRPADLARDETPTLPAVLHALDWFADDRGGDPTLTVIVQATSPLRGGGCLREAVSRLRADSDLGAVVGVSALARRPSQLYVADRDGLLAPLSDAAAPERLYTPNGAVYAVRTAALRAHGSLYPPRTGMIEMDATASIDIDTESDWRLAEAVLAAREAPLMAEQHA
jgi:CMP-N-acetylneuraminic acid synthetase